MKLVVLDKQDDNRLNAFVTSCPLVHFKQLYEWGKVLEYEGTQTIRLGVEKDGELCASLVAYVKKIPGSPLTFLSASRGPILEFKDRQALLCLMEGVREMAHRYRAIFLRVDPDLLDEQEGARNALLAAGFLHLANKNWSSLNDPRVIMSLDLNPPEAELLRRMRESHRQNIRLFTKKGFYLRDACDEKDVGRFYQLWRETGERRGFPVRSLAYYNNLWTHFISTGQGRLLLAEQNGEMIAALLMLTVGRKAWILHSGVTQAARRFKPNEAIWWEAIRWAKEQGATYCDFGGSGTDWPPQADSPGYSIYVFKRGFRAEAVYLTGYYDLVFRPRLYQFFRLAEERLLPRAVTTCNFLGALKKNKRMHGETTRDSQPDHMRLVH